jgi:glycosyltransferase involved in cell wall biosynthesis
VEWRLYGKVCESFRNEAEHLAHFHPDKVTLCGWRDPKDIYRNIDILVHASILFDSLPTTLIEAAQHGLPVVASSHGGAPEIVDDGKSGYLFDPSTPEQGFRYLKTLIKDPTLRTNMGNRAKELFRQRFSVRQMVAKYEDFWQIHEA